MLADRQNNPTQMKVTGCEMVRNISLFRTIHVHSWPDDIYHSDKNNSFQELIVKQQLPVSLAETDSSVVFT